MSNSYFVYILQCKDGSYYTGITKDVERRIRQHNGEIRGGAKYTRGKRPCKLIVKSIEMSKSQALKLEHQIKKLPKAKKVERLKNFSLKSNLYQKVKEEKLLKKCVCCSTTENLTWHHMLPRRVGVHLKVSPNKYKIRLCRTCHDKYEYEVDSHYVLHPFNADDIPELSVAVARWKSHFVRWLKREVESK